MLSSPQGSFPGVSSWQGSHWPLRLWQEELYFPPRDLPGVTNISASKCQLSHRAQFLGLCLVSLCKKLHLLRHQVVTERTRRRTRVCGTMLLCQVEGSQGLLAQLHLRLEIADRSLLSLCSMHSSMLPGTGTFSLAGSSLWLLSLRKCKFC